MRFCLVSEDTVPEETVGLQREACRERNIPFEVVTARAFDFDPAKRLQTGDMLYRAAVSIAALRAEQFLFVPGVATFHTAVDGVYFGINSETLLAESAGIPIPKTVYLASSAPELLRRQVERVGGFPVVVKVLGRYGGIGVMLAESTASLRSLVDFAIVQGHNPLLCEFIRDATHWRVVVLGGEAIATYRNRKIAEDFRSGGSRDPEIFRAVPPAMAIETAVRAAAVCRVDFAGGGSIRGSGGECLVPRSKFPLLLPARSVARRSRYCRPDGRLPRRQSRALRRTGQVRVKDRSVLAANRLRPMPGRIRAALP